MRQIRFRGKSVYLDEYVYGFAHQGFSGKWWIYPAPDLPNEPVYTGTVAQLVGYDKNGNEVYEGDILLDEHNNEHIAEIYDRPNFLTKLTLKEQPS